MKSFIILVYLFTIIFNCANGNNEARGTIRLVRQVNSSLPLNSGIVSIYYNNQWGNICDDFLFSNNEADVVCHQLSYTGAASFGRTGILSEFGTDTAPTLLEDVDCSSSDLLVLLQCSVTARYSSFCSSDENDVAVSCYTTRIWDNPFGGQVRLTGGEYSNHGLLEIYCNGQWGTVCDDSFYSVEASVSCRQLGYTGAVSYNSLSIQGNSSQPIWLDDVDCPSSSTTCLRACESCPVAEYHNCGHHEDVTLVCMYSSSQTSSTTEETCNVTVAVDTTGPSSDGAMRLYNGESTSLYNTAGRVQVWYDGQWGNICYGSTFDLVEANVICHQLGWSGASTYSQSSLDNFGTDYLPTTIDDVSCTQNTYLTIWQCSYSDIISSTCNNDNDVSVTCYTTRIWNSPFSSQIRLSRGTYSNQGLLEIYCNGQWGTVCDDLFGTTDIIVACRQLGYSTGQLLGTSSLSGNISQPIWLDNVACSTSSYSCLAYCDGCPSAEYHNCGHSEDVVLECSSTTRVYTTTSTCQSADSGSSVTTSPATTSLNVGALVGGIVGGTFFIIILSFMIPVCITICTGFAARSAIRSQTTAHTRVVSPTTVRVETTTNTTTTATPQNPAPQMTTSYDAKSGTAYKPSAPYNQYNDEQIYNPQYGYPTHTAQYTTAPQQAPPPYSDTTFTTQAPSPYSGSTFTSQAPPPYPV